LYACILSNDSIPIIMIKTSDNYTIQVKKTATDISSGLMIQLFGNKHKAVQSS